MYVLRSTFLEFLERLRACSVEHTSPADSSKSVVVIAIRLGFMTRLYLELQGLVGLLSACSELASTSGSILGYVSVTSPISSIGEKTSGEHSSAVPGVFLICSVEKADCTGISCALVVFIFVLGVKNWLFIVILPRCGIQIILFEAHNRIGFVFLLRYSYVSRGLAGCELTHSHAMKHLPLVGANYAYQIIVVWQHFFKNVRANPPKFCKWNFTPLMIRCRL